VSLIEIIIEAAGGELVQAENVLVGILHQDELAVFGLLQAHIGDRPDDTPAVGQLQVHLVGKVSGLPADNTEDNVLVVGLGVGTGDESIFVLVNMTAIGRVKNV